jgi:hypothetical protein
MPSRRLHCSCVPAPRKSEATQHAQQARGARCWSNGLLRFSSSAPLAARGEAARLLEADPVSA